MSSPVVEDAVTQERLRELFYYDPDSGDFIRTKGVKGNAKGKVAGDIKSNGYRYIGVDYKRYLAHRLAFLYMLGYMPKYVDHKNRNRSDNSWENLRAVNKNQNAQNGRDTAAASGVRNVYWDKRKSQYYAQVCAFSKVFTRMCGKDLEYAELVANEMREHLHGEYAYVKPS